MDHEASEVYEIEGTPPLEAKRPENFFYRKGFGLGERREVGPSAHDILEDQRNAHRRGVLQEYLGDENVVWDRLLSPREELLAQAAEGQSLAGEKPRAALVAPPAAGASVSPPQPSLAAGCSCRHRRYHDGHNCSAGEHDEHGVRDDAVRRASCVRGSTTTFTLRASMALSRACASC